MDLLQAAAGIGGVVGTLLGAGFGKKWLSRRIAEAKARAQERKAEANVAIRAIESADDAREDTQKHVTELVQCEKRCARLEATAEAQTRRVDDLEAKVDRLLGKIGTLESENVELRLRVGVLEEQVARLLPEAIKGFALTDEKPTPPRPALVRLRREE